MASDLKKYASSSFSEMTKYMSSSKKKEMVHIYVEDDLDKAFWSNLFKSFYGDKYRLAISLYHNVDDEPIPGKDAMLKAIKEHVLIPNPRQLCCVDADYDLFIDVPGKFSEIVRENIYVINTCMYSMENIKCIPSDVYNDIAFRVSLPNNGISFDFEKCIADVSETISDLVLITIVSKKNLDTEMSIDYLSSFVRDNLKFDSSHNVTGEFKNAVKDEVNKHNQYIITYAAEFERIRQVLLNRNIDNRQYYEIMQGHMLMEYIAAPLLVHVAEPIRSEFYCSLHGTCEQKKLASNHYAHNTGVCDDGNESLPQRIKSLLRDNYKIIDHAALDNIRQQFDRALQSRVALQNVIRSLSLHKIAVSGDFSLPNELVDIYEGNTQNV